MKISKKLILGAVAGTLALGAAIPLATTTSKTVTATSTNNLKLAHGAYVYNKAGKRLRTYRGSTWKTHLKKGAPLKFTGAIEPTERDSKRFFLLDDDNYNQSWLPYKQIKGQYYYGIGAGGYIKASNVSQIADKPLYTSEATVKIKDSRWTKPYTVGTGKDKTTIKNGKTFKIDRITSVQGDPDRFTKYRISGTTDAFLFADSVKIKPRQNLQIYTRSTYVVFSKETGTYNVHGTLRPITHTYSTFLKGDMYPVEELTYLWIPNENKAELFYLLKDSWGKPRVHSLANYVGDDFAGLIYIKASDVKYCSGPYLKPDNTPDQAQANSKIATVADKHELQNLINQEKTVNTDNHLYYSYALQFAKNINESALATITEVKKATTLLTNAQNAAINTTIEQEDIDMILSNTSPYINEKNSYYLKNRK
ncbi:SLAP domain-containing protein [Lactobacillus xylocopicola]|uniref:S-layer protein C-terminal domain-containing protein n=1 Tax=Lactobacillus xylocopicola TaxID=2976676 RepID=A0ABN6SN05_9LACO|nr:SLAP domain-containing protein [Lactobacillus xylocopicola]BDR61158.1 hypothetical protein KIM322_14190 [Lactobacillus xylocopicola]